MATENEKVSTRHCHQLSTRFQHDNSIPFEMTPIFKVLNNKTDVGGRKNEEVRPEFESTAK